MFSQTLFYFVVSMAIIVLGVLFAIVTYHIINITKELEKISNNFYDMSDEAKERIRDVLDGLSEVPILSFFIKRSSYRGEPQKTKKRSQK